MPKLNPTLVASRRFMKIERIARYELAGYSDVEIAMCMGITKQYVSLLRRTPEYIGRRMELASGVLASITGDMEEDVQASTDQLKQMVPSAVLALRSTLYDQTNPKLRFEAAKEILDREGTLAKVSKSEIKTKTTFDFLANDAITGDLLEALQENAAKVQEASDFVTTTEQPARTQEDINKILTLEDIEPQSKSVN